MEDVDSDSEAPDVDFVSQDFRFPCAYLVQSQRGFDGFEEDFDFPSFVA